jgi:abortive infection bacteriophage resistance protein
MNQMKRILYPHTALDMQQQVQLLVQKGLLISNPNAVMYWLSHNSYLRFKHYSLEFKDYKNNNGITFPKQPLKRYVIYIFLTEN